MAIADDAGEEERRQILTGFGIDNVFDISRTGGPPQPAAGRQDG